MNEQSEYNTLILDDTGYQTTFTPKYLKRKKYTPVDPKKLTSFIPGLIRNIYVRPGQTVKIGDVLLVLEAMKMKNTIKSNLDGKVKSIHVSPGEKVLKGQLLLEFE